LGARNAEGREPGRAGERADEFTSRGHENLPEFFGSQRFALGIESMLDAPPRVKALLPGETAMTDHLLPTTVVGSYPQPDWLVDRALLKTMVRACGCGSCGASPSRISRRRRTMRPCWRSATMERAGIDIITDGEMRRESYSNRFATALEASTTTTRDHHNRAGRSVEVPRVVGKIPAQEPGRARGHGVPAAQHRPPGEDHLARALHDGAAGEERVLPRPDEMVMDFAVALNAEAHDLARPAPT